MLLHSPSQRLKQCINPVDLCLKLNAEAITASAWFLPLKINTSSVMPRAPRASRLSAIAFHLTRLAHLTGYLLMFLPPALLVRSGAGHSRLVAAGAIIIAQRGICLFLSD